VSPAANDVLGVAACALLAGSAVGLCAGVLRSRAVRRYAAAYEQRVERTLRYLQIAVPARRFCWAQAAAVLACLGLAAAANSAWPLALGAAAAALPPYRIQRSARLRTQAIEAQLDTWMLALANTLRGNPALPAAIGASAELVGAPLCRELARVAAEVKLGVALDQALRHMAERSGSSTVSAAVTILRIARATGGDLSRTLETAAASLREMARLEGMVRSKTAEGRAQTAVIAAAPLGLVALLDEIDPGLLEPLWTTALGHCIAGAALALWAAALWLARKIVAVDV
jgi:tight adherence protein B